MFYPYSLYPVFIQPLTFIQFSLSLLVWIFFILYYFSGISEERKYKCLWSFCYVWVQILFTFSPLKEADLFEKTTSLYHRFFFFKKTYLYLIGKYTVQNSQGTKIYRMKILFSHIYPLNTSLPALEPTNFIISCVFFQNCFMSVYFPFVHKLLNSIHIVLYLAFHLTIDLRIYSISVLKKLFLKKECIVFHCINDYKLISPLLMNI